MRAAAYDMKFNPIVLKKLVLDCDISQGALAKVTGLARPTMNLLVNRGYMPTTVKDVKAKIEAFIKGSPRAVNWLLSRGLQVESIWEELGEEKRKAHPAGMSRRLSQAYAKKSVLSMAPNITEKEPEVEMLTHEAMKHFRLFRNPFQNDIRDVNDIYMSDEHRYIEAAMLDAARNGGFIAVIGEVGSGKSVIRKKVVAELSKDDNARVIFLKTKDTKRITAQSICDAIIMELSDERPKVKLEQLSRQVEKLLITRAKAGCHLCLLIEEAQDLNVRTLKLLKRFYEIEDGYRKVLGIVLIGQPELGVLFNEADYYDMREVIRRCQVAYIKGLNGNLKEYLVYKFKRVNVEVKNVITDEAVKALSDRLKDKDHRGKEFSKAYPLSVNNYIIKAMNLACEMGEKIVNEEVIRSL